MKQTAGVNAFLTPRVNTFYLFFNEFSIIGTETDPDPARAVPGEQIHPQIGNLSNIHGLQRASVPSFCCEESVFNE